MKTICNKLFFLICSAIILPFLGGGVLSAQSDILLDETWNFIEGNINGQAIQSPANFGNGFFDNLLGGDPYFEFFYSHTASQCYGFNIPYFDVSNSEFYLDEIIDIQTNTCQGGDILDFINKHNSFFVHLPIDTNGTPKNPFNYTIVSGNPYILTITNNEGDWVKYGGTMLSISVFNPDSFTLYPNPVGETLFVNTTFEQDLQAKLYDINGKLLQSNVVDASQANIDIRQLNAGLYFVVFENEAGERVSRKFIKQ